ncbi:MAG: membrane dipeptidase, partial [Clostridia bacterium]|nr:membrane dipeptidase [Clostridia bacterium]
NELSRIADRAVQVASGAELKAAVKAGKHAAILAVEDARLTAGKIERVDILAEMGVKYMTLLWGGETCIGGSHDTHGHLTDFGRAVARRCFEVGITPDVSHASEEVVDDLIPIAYEYNRPFIASHSNAHAVYGHTRNLRDRHFEHIKKLGGIVGISLCPSHLTDTSLRPADETDLLRHLEHYLSLGGESIVGFGADWDGTDLPQGFDHVGHLANFAELLGKHNYSDELIDKIFWKNFFEFAMKNL